MTEAELSNYLASVTEQHADAIRRVREMILTTLPFVQEEIDTGKWFGGLLTYNSPEVGFLYALGPRSGAVTLHMMPYYGIKSLPERYGPALGKLLTGKSCMRFSSWAEFPQEAVQGIFDATPIYIEAAKEIARKKKQKTKSNS